ncbi:hypothetical protein F4809DRAFT_589411 [Biscogniauxia mediterranea]|nr:hypothetical protein F4809DRAFT_589411 [Biscogniauxia mediterranea]
MGERGQAIGVIWRYLFFILSTSLTLRQRGIFTFKGVGGVRPLVVFFLPALEYKLVCNAAALFFLSFDYLVFKVLDFPSSLPPYHVLYIQ